MICLNSVIELIRRSSTINWQVWASTPVLISRDRMGSRVERVGFAWERGKVVGP